MGKMINLFDHSAGMSGTKMFADKFHGDECRISKGQANATRKSFDAEEIEEKKVTNESRISTSMKSCRTPMKMLIAQEMSKETQIQQKPPTVIARLMGLDALPDEEAAILKGGIPRCIRKSYTTGGITWDRQKQEYVHHDRTTRPHFEQRVYKDVYEVWQQPPRRSTNNLGDEHNSRHFLSEDSDEKRMSLVRQKFIEAKRLATSQNLLHCKEFQDALEVLSSNRDVFIKFLEEPNSLFASNLNEVETDPLPGQPKRITVLKPSKPQDMGTGNLSRSSRNAKECEVKTSSKSSCFVPLKAEIVSPKTRIVVLKPSPGKLQDAKPVVRSHNLSPKISEGGISSGVVEIEEARTSRVIAKEIARHMRDSVSSSRRDEMLSSSVLSNGYVGDESSFNRSEIGCMEEDCGSFSDSEVVTPTSRLSWDYVNRPESPCSETSFSRSPYSPESSVIREAKKRLSERWVMATSKCQSQEPRQEHRSVSTLGEMLALPRSDKEEETDGIPAASGSRSSVREEISMGSLFYLHSNNNDNENDGIFTPGSLQRSKSVPISPSRCDKTEPHVELPKSPIRQLSMPREVPKVKDRKSSFKGKISNFFFSKTKKSNEVKTSLSASAKSIDNAQSLANGNCDPAPLSAANCSIEKLLLRNLDPKSEHNGLKQSALHEVPIFSEKSSDHLEQPISLIFDAQYEDEISLRFSYDTGVGCERAISRSPLIESVARSLSWNNGLLSDKKPSVTWRHSTMKTNLEEQEKLLFVQSLLSSAGLATETSSTFLAKWYSIESPLNPALLEKLLEHREDAKCRIRRSSQKLLFDCVNAAILQLSCDVLSMDQLRTPKLICNTKSLTEDVLVEVRKWLNDDWRIFSCGDTSNLVLDMFVRKEVTRMEWSNAMRPETSEIGVVIEAQILEELVEEVLDGFTTGCRR